MGNGVPKVHDWVAVPITFYVFLVTLVSSAARDVYNEKIGSIQLCLGLVSRRGPHAICFSMRKEG